MDKENINMVVSQAKQEIGRLLERFQAELNAGTSDAEHFMTLSEIEQKWTELENATSKIYSNIVASYLSGLDESAVIKLKKENIEKRG